MGMAPDAILFLISQPYLSGKRLAALKSGLIDACPLPCAVARMEGREAGPMTALGGLAANGARHIRVQPVGIPFSDSLAAWLPGALAHWQRESGHEGLRLSLARDQVDDAGLLAALAQSALSAPAEDIDPAEGSMDGAGWDEVPAFRHHLLVCIGPRCNFREVGPLKSVLAEEIAKAGLARDCLLATTGCLFPCNAGPVVAHYPAGRWYRLRDASDAARFVSTVLKTGHSLPDLLIHEVSR